ncbi:SH3 domain-containing protein [Paraburkholderia tagetis]|uniref:Peptide-binding protein n=1 Tax=Paraburkholderia tagetis TaxID=2913261 RepID=A0A9X1UEI8_9BURK|nr:SH3 domain-containing protein [Paraburkholderia tagetis]MCG5073270.1 peptide-binding protein [Paraburkholderia tagetis]
MTNQYMKPRRGLALPLATVCMAAAMAFAAPGVRAQTRAYTSEPVELFAGPSDEYPVVSELGPNVPVTVMGCVSDYTWCDVALPDLRGWVYGGYLSYPYQGAYVPLTGYGAAIGLPIVSFSIGAYWGSFYRDRPWYGDRDRWAHAPPPSRGRPPEPRYHGGPPGGAGRPLPPPGAGRPPEPGRGPGNEAPPVHGRPPVNGGPPVAAPRPPAEGARPPAEMQRPPGEGARPPVEMQRPPGERARQPAEMQRPPGEGARQPAEMQRPPGEGARQPAEMQRQPAEMQRPPGEGARQPAEVQRPPMQQPNMGRPPAPAQAPAPAFNRAPGPPPGTARPPEPPAARGRPEAPPQGGPVQGRGEQRQQN